MSVFHKVQPHPQQTSSTCWLACLWMLHDYMNLPKGDVKGKIERYKASGEVPDNEPPICEYQYMKTHGMGKEDAKHVARAMNFLYGGEFTRPVGIEVLIECLKKYGPMMCCGPFNGGAHAILVVGARDAKVPMVRYIDPWEQFGGSEEMEKSLDWWYKGVWKDTLGAVMYWPKAK